MIKIFPAFTKRVAGSQGKHCVCSAVILLILFWIEGQEKHAGIGATKSDLSLLTYFPFAQTPSPKVTLHPHS